MANTSFTIPTDIKVAYSLGDIALCVSVIANQCNTIETTRKEEILNYLRIFVNDVVMIDSKKGSVFNRRNVFRAFRLLAEGVITGTVDPNPILTNKEFMAFNDDAMDVFLFCAMQIDLEDEALNNLFQLAARMKSHICYGSLQDALSLALRQHYIDMSDVHLGNNCHSNLVTCIGERFLGQYRAVTFFRMRMFLMTLPFKDSIFASDKVFLNSVKRLQMDLATIAKAEKSFLQGSACLDPKSLVANRINDNERQGIISFVVDAPNVKKPGYASTLDDEYLKKHLIEKLETADVKTEFLEDLK